jgi:hypothetical protein
LEVETDYLETGFCQKPTDRPAAAAAAHDYKISYFHGMSLQVVYMPASASNFLTAFPVSPDEYSLSGCLYSPNSIDTARRHGSGAEVRIPSMAYNMSLANWTRNAEEWGCVPLGHSDALLASKSVASNAQSTAPAFFLASTTPLSKGQHGV